MRCTSARRWRGTLVGVIERVIHPLHQALQHRNFNVAADAGFFPQQYGREDARIGIHTGSDISYRVARLGHPVFAGPTGDRKKTAFALDQQVIGFFLLVGAPSAIAGDVADDEPREALVQLLEAQPKAGGRAWRQVLHQHIGLLQ
ncbi:hypothetical protein D3C80_611550 [compost metagenome]